MSTLSDPILLVSVALGATFVLMTLGYLWVVRPWVRAFSSGTFVPLLYILGMRLRGTPPGLLIDAYIALLKAGETVDLALVEAVYLANRSADRNEQDLVHKVEEAMRKERE